MLLECSLTMLRFFYCCRIFPEGDICDEVLTRLLAHIQIAINYNMESGKAY
jgi:hypothetical protein